ncbi:signal recognition particle 9 kDa protein-domain-containing protein [Aspergillus californicus]
MPSGPYLPTSAAYLKQSSLLLQAYPDTTRITTKYTFPSKPPTSTSASTKPSTQQQPTTPPSTTQPTTPAAPIATLTLKTYTPEAGICLKYRTNKAAEVGRLITALGLLAGGADILGLDSTSAVVEGGGEEEAAGVTTGTTAVPAATQGQAQAQAGGKGKGKGKKKGKK